jgi:3-methyladenine DNA glycosylase AlkD
VPAITTLHARAERATRKAPDTLRAVRNAIVVPLTLDQILSRIERAPQRNAAGLRSLRKQFSEELAAADRATVMDIAIQLVESGKPDARFIAYELVKCHPAARESIAAAEVERLGEGISDWAAVDCFGCYIAGPAWREGRVSDARIHKWARSKNLWWRRAALVSTVPLNVRAQGGEGDAERTLAVCELLIEDRAEMVVKAMSWALRALAVRDPKAVSHFVQEHETELAALVKREVRNKLRTGVKNPKKNKVS